MPFAREQVAPYPMKYPETQRLLAVNAWSDVHVFTVVDQVNKFRISSRYSVTETQRAWHLLLMFASLRVTDSQQARAKALGVQGNFSLLGLAHGLGQSPNETRQSVNPTCRGYKSVLTTCMGQG